MVHDNDAPPSSTGGAQCKQGKACGRRPAGVHTGKRDADGVLATIPGRVGGPSQHMNTEAYAHGYGIRSNVAGGGADAESRAEWCAVRVAPRPLSDGLNSFLRMDGRRSVERDRHSLAPRLSMQLARSPR